MSTPSMTTDPEVACCFAHVAVPSLQRLVRLMLCEHPRLLGKRDAEQSRCDERVLARERFRSFSIGVSKRARSVTPLKVEDAERQLYQMLRDKLPQTTIVSIGHRSTLQAFHTRSLELTDDGHGSRVLTPA